MLKSAWRHRREDHSCEEISPCPYRGETLLEKRRFSNVNQIDEKFDPDTPICPEFSSLNSRLESFQAWPLQSPTVEELASAGFFYTGPDDEVECFWCGITLWNWEPEHKPFIEHKQCSSDCPFLREKAENYAEDQGDDPDSPGLVLTESSAPAEEGEQSGDTNYSPAKADERGFPEVNQFDGNYKSETPLKRLRLDGI